MTNNAPLYCHKIMKKLNELWQYPAKYVPSINRIFAYCNAYTINLMNIFNGVLNHKELNAVIYIYMKYTRIQIIYMLFRHACTRISNYNSPLQTAVKIFINSIMLLFTNFTYFT